MSLLTRQYQDTERVDNGLKKEIECARQKMDSLSTVIGQLKTSPEKQHNLLPHAVLDKKLKEAQEITANLDSLSAQKRSCENILKDLRRQLVLVIDREIGLENKRLQTAVSEQDKLGMLHQLETWQKQRDFYEAKESGTLAPYLVSSQKESTGLVTTLEECAEQLEKVRFVAEKKKKEAADINRRIKKTEEQVVLLEKTIGFVANTEGLESTEKGYLKTKEEYESELFFLKGRLLELKEQGQAADKELKKLQEQEAALNKLLATFK